MTRSTLSKLALLGLGSVMLAGCASSPASPFNQMEKSTVTAFRLQNYEPPAAAAAPAAGAAGATNLIPGLPAEINQWIQQGAQGLQQLIPPGLLPPGLLQGGQAAVAATPVVENVPRFYTYRILGQTQVMSEDLRTQMAELFGNDGNFETPKSQCMYPEMGVAFGPQGGATFDMLVSFSCGQVQAKNFQWPHPQTGLKTETVKELSDIVRKLWPI